MRKFETGATRNDDSNKYDYEGFLSPLILKALATSCLPLTLEEMEVQDQEVLEEV